ncbi:MAG: protein translocase subunit SecD [Synergistes jonesii]|uniref:protein translocase subunit SecD n=1 Tax=Synergistes jonesii TaxID=2754 RepID=UPI002A74A3AB|nr:protein translocase subunit SecD [Synergistes jonesii]MDY2984105.1 protein translocase subunit SecD [Synergistes jonesii]
MLKRDRWRLIVVAAVVLIAAAVAFPIKGKVRLGLDLRGGVHIILQAKGTPESPLTADSLERLLVVLRSRIDQYGIAEPLIQREGEDRIAVDLPGVEDPEAALDLIGRTAVLQFRQVLGESPRVPAEPIRSNYDSDDQFKAAEERWNAAKNEVEEYVKQMEEAVKTNPDMLVAKSENGSAYLLGKMYVGGGDLTKAETNFDQFGKAAVSLKFNPEGAKLFDEATAANIQKQIAIVLDNVVISAPVVQQRISGGEAQITGSFTTAEANRLAIMLRAGALPVEVEVLENRSVGPSLGADSIHDGVKSGLIGAALVVAFMIVYYGMLGIAADIALAVAMLLVVAAIIALKSTLTLPGIGGMVLTIGMAVDGNILIYERMKEEFRSGKTIMAALDAGFRKALVVILDSNITTLIAAAILFYFGSGPIRGFAVTLSVGVVASVFCNTVVTRTLLGIMLSARKNATF